MAKFTKEMEQRLKDQGWKFFQMDYWDFPNIDFQLFEANIYLNNKYPGVYIKETAFGNFEIYSDVIYKTEKEKLYETYDQGYNNGYKIAKIESGLNPFRSEEMALKLYNLGYSRGYSNGYKIAKIKNPLNFFPKTRRKIKQIKEILWQNSQRK